MIEPADLGRRVAEHVRALAPELRDQVLDSAPLRAWSPAIDPARVTGEWAAFVTFAATRGLVAASGFGAATGQAVQALEEAMVPKAFVEPVRARRREYGAVALEGGAASAAAAPSRIGRLAARHLFGSDDAPADVAELLGAMHEAIAESVVDFVRGATDGAVDGGAR